MKKLITSGILTAVFIFSCFKGGVLNRNLIFRTNNGNVVFSHAYHVKVKKIHCSSCHPGLFKRKFGGDKITMQDIWKGKYCGSCHNGTRAFDAKNPKNCSRCHRQNTK